ncbi:hypothetical protein D3C76_1557920 [compost metagenome]
MDLFFDLALIKPPIASRIAGTIKIAMRTATKMQSAAAKPIAVRKGIPITDIPARPIITVMPAKTTALPAVPFAIAIASFLS